MCDLNLSYGFGPEQDGPLGHVLLLAMRKGKLHKDRHGTDKEVCCWHHKQYKLCSVFSIAAHVIWNLTQIPDISFMHENKKNTYATWWDIPLIDWEADNGEYYCTVLIDVVSYSHDLPCFTTGASSSMKEIYKATRVLSCKDLIN